MDSSKNAVIYARYSSDNQREESIEGQIRVCEDYARKNGFNVINIYADRALTGRTDKRPQFQLMIKDSETMTFRHVIVYKLNRFARNRYDSAVYKNKLKKNGVKLVSAMENIADDPSGILLESVIEGLAEYYSAELAENVRRGMTENALDCRYTGGAVPMGLKIDENGHFMPDYPAANIIYQIFKAAASGAEYREILDRFNSPDNVAVLGRKITRGTLLKMLKNEKYIGTYSWNGIRKENAFPAVVDKKTFEFIQDLRRSRMHKHQSKPYEYPLSGKLFCRCGAPMVGTSGTSKNGSIYNYYSCTTHLKSTENCKQKSIPRDDIETTIVRAVTDILSDEKAVDILAKQVVALAKSKGEPQEILTIESQISDLDKKIAHAVAAIEKGISSPALFSSLNENEAKKSELSAALARERLRHRGTNITEETIRQFFRSMRDKDFSNEQYRRILLRSIVNKVQIGDGEIIISFNYTQKLPTLPNPVKVESSYTATLAERGRFELPHRKPV